MQGGTPAEKVTAELAEWSSRPLDPIYPVIFVDAIVVKVRDGQVRNTPFYVVMGVTVSGERDIRPARGRDPQVSGPATVLKAPGSGCRCSAS